MNDFQMDLYNIVISSVLYKNLQATDSALEYEKKRVWSKSISVVNFYDVNQVLPNA